MLFNNYKRRKNFTRNIYDSSKYINLIEATKELNKASKEFTDTEFEIIAIDRRVFGRKPRFVIDG